MKIDDTVEIVEQITDHVEQQEAPKSFDDLYQQIASLSATVNELNGVIKTLKDANSKLATTNTTVTNTAANVSTPDVRPSNKTPENIIADIFLPKKNGNVF